MSRAPIGLFYGSSTCYTEIAAEKIRDWFGDDNAGEPIVVLHNIADTGVLPMADFDRLILGIPTWDYGELQEDWENHWPMLDQLDLSGKTIALYGLGDQIGYPEWFQDAMGYLYQRVLELGGDCIGFWSAEGYQYVSSLAVTDDKSAFVGLALDDETEFELSDQRIQDWCQQIQRSFFPEK